MLPHRRRRWASIKATLENECGLFAVNAGEQEDNG